MVDPKTIEAVGVSLKKDEHKPLWAAFVAVRNTPEARIFIERWIHLCEQKQLITQYLNDQMLLGLTAHK